MITVKNTTFFSDIEVLCSKGVPILDAVTTWCETNKIDVEIAASFIRKNPELKSKMLEEALQSNNIKAPIDK